MTRAGSLASRGKACSAAYFDEWTRVRCTSRAAALAFYTTFSLAPTLLLVVIVGAVFVDTARLQDALLIEARNLMGDAGSKLIAGILERSQQPGQGWPALFGTVMLIFGATTVFAELKDSLDEIFKVPASRTTGIWDVMRTRLLSLGLILALVFLLLVSLVAEALFTAASTELSQRFGWHQLETGRLFTFGMSCVGSFALFLAIYALLPSRRMPWRALIFGALSSMILFTLGRWAIGLYLSHSDAVAAFGAAGSLAIVLMWIYYSSVAFFAGALAAQIFEHPFADDKVPEANGREPAAARGSAPPDGRLSRVS